MILMIYGHICFLKIPEALYPNAVLEIFPGIQENIELVKEFEKDPDFGSDMIVDEVFDSVRGFLLNLPDQIKDAYNAINPPECKV